MPLDRDELRKAFFFCKGIGLGDLPSKAVGDTDISGLACLHDAVQTVHDVFDGRLPVPHVIDVQIHVVHPEVLEACVDHVLDVLLSADAAFNEQFTSYTAQVEYYTKYIQEHEDWEFVKVYTDEGITGTSTKHRKGFQQMVDDALAGKIDLIVTKSVSRFARNTVDSLVNIRLLKDAGCECYFEEQNIWTFDSTGELLITILSSIAQDEARNISENVTWGHRKRFADGKIMMPYKNFLGYERGEDGNPVINEEEAKTVRLIYRLFLEGKTPYAICRYLDDQCIPTPTGKTRWIENTIISILTNEKYKGDALLQKSFTTTPPLLIRVTGKWCRRNSHAAKESADPTAERTFSPQS